MNKKVIKGNRMKLITVAGHPSSGKAAEGEVFVLIVPEKQQLGKVIK